MNAVHVAIAEGYLDLVKFLAPLVGEHIYDVDYKGQNCLEWAENYEQHRIALYLASSFLALRKKVRLMLLYSMSVAM